MKRLITFLVAISALTMLFSGCGSSGSAEEATLPDTESLVEPGNIHKPADIIGSWTLKTVMDENFLCRTVEEYCADLDIELSTFRDTFTFNEDNTATHTLDENTTNGTYQFDDPTYSMVCQFNNAEYDMTYDYRYDMFYIVDTESGITKEYGRD